MMNIQWLSISMILIVLSLVHINASEYQSIRQATTEQCQHPDVPFCDFIQCENGQCVENKTSIDCFKCQCSVGFTGILCETPVATTSGCNPACENGGQCQPTGTNTYACVCPAGFTGEQCQTSVLATHPCVTMPGTVCQNGGTCTVNGPSYLCNCPIGWSGANCQTQDIVTTCNSNTCGAYGTCLQAILPDGSPAVFCQCDAQWTGKYCDTNLAANCPNGFCQSGGTCLMNGNTPFCICPLTHTGQQCETFIGSFTTTTPDTTGTTTTAIFPTTVTTTAGPTTGSCTSNSCINGGTCYNTGNNFICLCPITHTGQQCEIFVGSFTTTTTTTDTTGTATTYTTGTTTTYTTGTATTYTTGTATTTTTTGPTTGSCTSSSCLNGGTCYNTGNDFICLCKPEYSGRACSIQNSLTTTFPTTASSTNACLPNPCNNGGTCYKHSSGFVCVCSAQYTGQTCDMARTATTPPLTTPSSTITCANQPCQNGGTCYNAGSSYFCYCGGSSGYTGKNCETVAVASDPNCSLDCSPGYCVSSGGSNQNAYACMCNGVLTPSSCSSK